MAESVCLVVVVVDVVLAAQSSQLCMGEEEMEEDEGTKGCPSPSGEINAWSEIWHVPS